MRNTRRAPWSGLYCARSFRRRICAMLSWRNGPSGGNVRKSGCDAKTSGSSLRLSAGSFSRAAIRERLSSRLRSSRSIFSGEPSMRAAKRRASVALPRPSRPEKRRVCGMRSRPIMLSSVVWTGRLPQKFSNTAVQRLPEVTRHLADTGAAIDHDEAIGLGGREIEVTAANALMEGRALVIDARFSLANALVPAFGASEAGFEIDIDQDGEVGAQSLTGDPVELTNDGRIEAAATALVNERRIGEAIAEHDPAFGERGADDFLHVLGAAGEIEQQFGAAGLHGFDDFAAAFAQVLGQEAELRGFAAAVHTFESEETALRGRWRH